MAGEAPPGYSSGGMVTKLAAGRIAIAAGCRMAIADGRRMNPLAALAEGAPCSWFLPLAGPLTARKTWIAGSLKAVGAFRVDAGALAALKAGKSLLPAGVKAVEGEFDRGDAVLVLDGDGREVARGLSAYASADARAILGHKSGEVDDESLKLAQDSIQPSLRPLIAERNDISAELQNLQKTLPTTVEVSEPDRRMNQSNELSRQDLVHL